MSDNSRVSEYQENGLTNCLSTEGANLEGIIITAELSHRTPRPPDFEAENLAFVTLAQEMSNSPQTLLQRLVEIGLDLCKAGTAGISLLETDEDREIFRWKEVAGVYKACIGGSTPRNFSPCGTCLDRNAPQLYLYPGRYFTYFNEVEGPPIVEGLVIPFYSSNQPLGTIWIVSHNEHRKFDKEDVRVMTNLGSFTAAALQLLSSVDSANQSKKELQILLEEKGMLLKEVHHRVKNNLQIISSLINLQSKYIEDSHTLEKLKETQDRVKSMALIHEKLYQSENLSEINFAEYVRSLSRYLFKSYRVNPNIKLKMDVDNVGVNINKAIPCGLIINELVSNALKYAFPDGRTGKVSIKFGLDNDSYTLVINNNGIPFPEGMDFRNTKSLGLQLVYALTEQLKGTIELDRSSGAEFRIKFSP